MKLTLQPQLLLRFESASAQRCARGLLIGLRSILLVVYVFYAKFHPLESLFGMRFESGWFLLGMGAVLNVPLYALLRLAPSLLPFAFEGLPFPHTAGPPTWRYLVVAVPLYLSLGFAWRPMARLARRVFTSADALAVRFTPLIVRNAAPFFLRAVVCTAVLCVVVRYGFTPQFQGVGDPNYLLSQRGVARLFLYLSLVPNLPLLWLTGHSGTIGLASLYPSMPLVLTNALLIAILATVARSPFLRGSSALGGHPKTP